MVKVPDVRLVSELKGYKGAQMKHQLERGLTRDSIGI